MADGVEKIIESARARFPDDVVDALERSGILESDLTKLTRDDVNSEFKGLKFGVRKSIFSFLKGVASIEEASSSSEAVVLDTSSSSVGTEPCHEPEEYLLSSSTGDTTRAPKRSKLFQKFGIDPKRPIPASKQLEDYPGTIPASFPLSPILQNFLHLPREEFLKNRPVFLQVVREVARVLEHNLGRKPVKEEMVATSRRLCQEYPVLQCGKEECHGALYEAIKKRMLNVRTNISNREDWVKKQIQKPAFREVPDTESAKDVLRKIQEMPGEGIARRVLDYYPYFVDSEKCLWVFALAQGRRREELLQTADMKWSNLKKDILGDDVEASPCLAMVQAMKKIAGEFSTYIVQHGLCDYRKGKPDGKQPYILLPDSVDHTFNVAIMVDEMPFVEHNAQNTDGHCATVLLLLLAVYFTLNLEYPTKAKKAYRQLQTLVELDRLDLA